MDLGFELVKNIGPGEIDRQRGNAEGNLGDLPSLAKAEMKEAIAQDPQNSRAGDSDENGPPVGPKGARPLSDQRATSLLPIASKKEVWQPRVSTV